MFDADELTDRSERFMAAEMVREKLFRLTGDELPYTSTVHHRQVRGGGPAAPHRRHHRGRARRPQGHGDRRRAAKLKRIGTEARQSSKLLWDCKVFLELWVKVRSGWADDEARVRSFGYE